MLTTIRKSCVRQNLRHRCATFAIPIAQLTPPFPSEWTLADIQQLLGDIPLNRIAIQPALGNATEFDVERLHSSTGKLFELEYGILVEKAMGWYESIIGILVSHALRTYLDQHDLGQVLGADGLIKILPGVVKIPDVCFISWDRFVLCELLDCPSCDYLLIHGCTG